MMGDGDAIIYLPDDKKAVEIGRATRSIKARTQLIRGEIQAQLHSVQRLHRSFFAKRQVDPFKWVRRGLLAAAALSGGVTAAVAYEGDEDTREYAAVSAVASLAFTGLWAAAFPPKAKMIRVEHCSVMIPFSALSRCAIDNLIDDWKEAEALLYAENTLMRPSESFVDQLLTELSTRGSLWPTKLIKRISAGILEYQNAASRLDLHQCATDPRPDALAFAGVEGHTYADLQAGANKHTVGDSFTVGVLSAECLSFTFEGRAYMVPVSRPEKLRVSMSAVVGVGAADLAKVETLVALRTLAAVRVADALKQVHVRAAESAKVAAGTRAFVEHQWSSIWERSRALHDAAEASGFQ